MSKIRLALLFVVKSTLVVLLIAGLTLLWRPHSAAAATYSESSSEIVQSACAPQPYMRFNVFVKSITSSADNPTRITFSITPSFIQDGESYINTIVLKPDPLTDVLSEGKNQTQGMVREAAYSPDNPLPEFVASTPPTNLNFKNTMQVKFETICTLDGQHIVSQLETELTFDGALGPNQSAPNSGNDYPTQDGNSSNSGTGNSASQNSNQQADQQNTQAEATQPYLINESEEYRSGQGIVVWLKPEEKVRFNLGEGDSAEEHTVTIGAVGNDTATITIASEPQELTLKVNEEKNIDVNQDGTNDINFRLVAVVDGSAGLQIRPLSDDAKVMPPPVAAMAISTSGTSVWMWVGAAAGVLALIAAALVILIRASLITMPGWLAKSRIGAWLGKDKTKNITS